MGVKVITPLDPLDVRQMHGSKFWLTLKDYTLFVRLDALHQITIPAGFRYDRSSIPDFAEWIVSKDDLGCIAPLVHDALYNCEGQPIDYPQMLPKDRALSFPRPWCHPEHEFTRSETDELFYQIMLSDQVKPWRARLAYWAVRLFGGTWQ